MKHFILLFLTIALFTVACKKSETPANGFVGKWKLIAQKTSIGGPAVWYDETIHHPEYYILFDNNGKFVSNSYMVSDYTKYSIKDTAIVVLSKNDAIQNFSYKFIKQDTLLMSPAGPIYCIEGCTFKFLRQK